MNLRLFQRRFQTEEACQQHLFALRWPDGFRCPACGHDRYYKISNRLLFQCTACRHQTSFIDGR
ncbi:transposase [Alicyclobacillus herbarius]|uniref:transposase n=1 Tax=Alicyclobacillus herbarius TaxID=122960 RepID=UPI003CCC1063